MARRKKITEKDIYTYYMAYYLENSEPPKSVYQLAKLHNFDEKQFYDFFGGISGIEKSIFQSFLAQTIELLHSSEEYQRFDERNKLLTFYYTFFEVLTSNRSFVIMVLERDKKSSKLLKTISAIKPAYLEFIKELEIEKLEIRHARAEKIVNKSMDETYWVQLLLCLKFWMEDDSASLEKTDIFIEKSINTGFDLLNVQPLRSVLDLGKFLFHEKIHMN